MLVIAAQAKLQQGDAIGADALFTRAAKLKSEDPGIRTALAAARVGKADQADGEIFNGLIAVQWALVDHDPGFGGFRCIPGSHKANFELPDAAASDLAIDLALSAGDVVFFTEALTHGTSTWRAPYERMSLFYKYAPGYLAWGRNYEYELASSVLRDLCTPRQQRFLQPPAVYPHDSI